MEDSNTNKKNDKPNGFQPKVLFIWLFLILMIVSLWMSSPNQAAGRAGGKKIWTVTEVIEAADAKQIRKATIKADTSKGPEWYVIQGEAVNPDYKLEGQNAPDVMETIKFTAQGRLTSKRYNELLAVGSNISEKPASTLITELLFSLLPFLVIIGILYFLFVRQLRLAGKGAMSFGKSKARMLTRDKERISFKDVAGCKEALEEVSEIVEFLSNPKKFQDIGGRIPKGILMVGPPGTGKTLIAKAIAGEADVPFFTISGSDFVEMFVGVGAARVRDMFEQGRKNAPCLIFIDEIDAVGRQRGAGLGGGNDEREQTLNSLLVEMDGFDGHEGVIIIAATNRPDVLDSALLRPGRFDRQVVIDLPDIMGREEILKLHAKKIKLRKDVDLSVVARNTSGFSGADLENLLNESALHAARANCKEIEMIHIDEAREKIAYGRERRKLMDDEDKKITAFHEAGHAIVQACIDDGRLPVHKVTIIPRGQSLGSTMFIPKKDMLNYGKKFCENQICCSMGGRVAEELALQEVTSGASGDFKSATKIARHMVCDWGMYNELGPVTYGENRDHIFLGKEISRDQNYSEQTAQKIDKAIHDILVQQYNRATEILQKHRKELNVLAQALLEYETLEGKHVDEVLKYGEIKSDIYKQAPESEQEASDDKKETSQDAKKDAQSLDAADAAAAPA